MKYFAIFISFLQYLKDIFMYLTNSKQKKIHEKETEKVTEFKKETEKNVKKGEIDAINEKLKF